VFENYVGTTGTQSYELRIDRKVPSCEVSYAPTSGSRTSGNVIASLVNCSEPIITGINEGSYIFTGNGTHEFNFMDELGNS
jgi:hypothetical protein